MWRYGASAATEFAVELLSRFGALFEHD